MQPALTVDFFKFIYLLLLFFLNKGHNDLKHCVMLNAKLPKFSGEHNLSIFVIFFLERPECF